MGEDMYTKIAEDMKQAMKDGDKMKLSSLRMAIAEIKNINVVDGQEITDEVCMKVLRKQAKMHEDSIAQFKAAGRDDLVQKEEAELAAIQGYLPKPMSQEETIAAVEKVIADNGFEKSRRMMRDIMTALGKISGIDRKAAAAYLSKELH